MSWLSHALSTQNLKCTSCGSRGHLKTTCYPTFCFYCKENNLVYKNHTLTNCWKFKKIKKSVCTICYLNGHHDKDCERLCKCIVSSNGDYHDESKCAYCWNCGSSSHKSNKCNKHKNI